MRKDCETNAMLTYTYHIPDSPELCWIDQLPQAREDICFFDIETTGLSPKASSLYLLGVMTWDASRKDWTLVQWFADNYHSEVPMIEAFFRLLAGRKLLCHFNGDTFDIPYILHKCQKHQITVDAHTDRLLHEDSFDLLKHIRPLKKKLGLIHANQTALERWLGIHREDEYDGGRLIPVYAQYMQQKILHPEQAENSLHLLLLHNHDDMLGMLQVGRLLSYESALLQPDLSYADSQWSAQPGQICKIRGTLHTPVPKPVSLTGSQDSRIHLDIHEDTITLTLPVFQGECRHFFNDYRNYYYLPMEDTAIHKSVGEFVDPSSRKKATAATCYVRQSGSYLPLSFTKKSQCRDCTQTLFFTEYQVLPAYINCKPGQEDPTVMEWILRTQVPLLP